MKDDKKKEKIDVGKHVEGMVKLAEKLAKDNARRRAIDEEEAAAGLGALFGPDDAEKDLKERLAKWEKYYAQVRKDQLVLNIAHFKVENEEMAKKYVALEMQLHTERQSSREVYTQARDNTVEALKQADRLLAQRDDLTQKVALLDAHLNGMMTDRDELHRHYDDATKEIKRLQDVVEKQHLKLMRAHKLIHDLTE